MNFGSFRKYIGKIDHKLLIVIGLFVVAGLITLAITKATSQSISAEVENGIPAKGATFVTDPLASSGSAVAFGSGTGNSPFQKLSSVRTPPAPYNKLIGPGVTTGSQKFYLGYQNLSNPFSFV